MGNIISVILQLVIEHVGGAILQALRRSYGKVEEPPISKSVTKQTVTFCRFDKDRRLSYHNLDLDDETLSFIAISHIWTENTSWVRIPGIPQEVKASPQKAEFIEEKLPELVGDNLFWMDILAVNQRDRNAVIAVVESIPMIYKRAMKTIIVREAGGFKECCSRMNTISGKVAIANHLEISIEHITRYHSCGFDEKWLKRLWPLQELNLSDNLQFTVCGSGSEDNAAQFVKLSLEEAMPLCSVFGSELDELRSLHLHWLTGSRAAERVYGALTVRSGSPETADLYFERLSHQFINACLTNGTVSRAFPDEMDIEDGKGYNNHEEDNDDDDGTGGVLLTLIRSKGSGRVAEKNRDLVLALFPNCKWYHVPPDARHLPFGDLWKDLMDQIETLFNPLEREHYLRPLITTGMLSLNIDSKVSAAPAANIPFPSTLGDFCRLFVVVDKERWWTEERPIPKRFQGPWELDIIDETWPMPEILEVISETIMFTMNTYSSRYENRVGIYQLAGLGLGELIRQTSADPSSTPRLAKAGSASRLNQREELLLALEIFLVVNDMHSDFCEGLEFDSNPRVCMPEMCWYLINRTAAEYDSPSLRALLVQLSVVAASNLNIKNLKWSQNNLQPYVLTQTRPADGYGPEFCTPSRVLVLGAKGLLVDGGSGNTYYAYNSPDDLYLYMDATSIATNSKATRVVGMVPFPAIVQRDRFATFMRRGCPTALPTDNHGVVLHRYANWYRHKSSRYMNTLRDRPFDRDDWTNIVNPPPSLAHIGRLSFPTKIPEARALFQKYDRVRNVWEIPAYLPMNNIYCVNIYQALAGNCIDENEEVARILIEQFRIYQAVAYDGAPLGLLLQYLHMLK